MPSIQETIKKGDFGFNDIQISPYNTRGVVGTLYFKKGMPTTKGIVVLHGMWGTREDLGLFNKRLADQGYYVYAINLPAHGEDLSQFNIALASENVLTAVRALKDAGMKKVGVVGYSGGAVAALFALCGYTRKIEREVYVFFQKCLVVMKGILHMENKYSISEIGEQLISLMKIGLIKDEKKLQAHIIGEAQKMRQYANQFVFYFNKIKEIILEALDNKIKKNQMFDALVLCGIPLGFQDAIVFPMSWMKKYPEAFKRIISRVNKTGKDFATKYGLLYRYTAKNRALLDNAFFQNDDIQWLFFRMGNLEEGADYLNDIKNPRDFIHLVDVFSRKEFQSYEEREIARIEQKKQSLRRIYGGDKRIEAAIKELGQNAPVFSRIRKYKKETIDSVPKFIVFGGLDQWSRPLVPWNRVKMKRFFDSLGEVKVKSYLLLDHGLDERGIHLKAKNPLSNPKMDKDILHFLNHAL